MIKWAQHEEEAIMLHQREDIIGKTITGVITRNAGRSRNPSLVLLQFSDGSYFEFVSTGALKSLASKHPDSLMDGSGDSANDSANAALQLAIAGM